MERKRVRGMCPFCREEFGIYKSSEEQEFYSIFTFYCPDCEKEWNEYFRLEYEGYSYEDDDGVTREFDVDGKEMEN